jgi:hypothetical protein
MAGSEAGGVPSAGVPDGGVSEDAIGPWVVVVGMHRSGTSAVTGAVGALGFNLVSAEDRLTPHDSNPEHWESLSILLHNDAILARFGGTWDAPPQLPDGWETDRGLPDYASALKLLAAAYPDLGPSVWKDPRACLLLPYWREVLRAPMAAVLVWRAPLAVARSLRHRDGLPVAYGVALWERYNRSAIANLAGTDVYVLNYDVLVQDPAGSLSGLTSWLGSIGTFDGMRPWDQERALSVVTTNLRHESEKKTDDDDHIVMDEQRRLVEHLTELSGGHHGLPQLAGNESPWTEAILDARRSSNVLELRKLKSRLEHSDAERDWFASALADARAELDRVQSQLAHLKASSSWRVTAPVRSVVAVWAASRDRRTKG